MGRVATLKAQLRPICGVARSLKWREPFRRFVRLAAGPHLRFQGTTMGNYSGAACALQLGHFCVFRAPK